MAISETFCVVLRVGPVTLRLLGGCIAKVNTAATAQAEVVQAIPDVPLSFWGPLSVFSAPPWGSVLVCLPLRASLPFFYLPYSFPFE